MKFYDDGDALTEPRGFFCSGVPCDVKGRHDGKLDLGIIYSKKPCSVAGVFTTNDVRAAPVRYCESLVKEKVRLSSMLSLQIVATQMHVRADKENWIPRKWPLKWHAILTSIQKRF